MTSKVNGSLIMTKQSEHIITPFFSKYINTPSQVVATLATTTKGAQDADMSQASGTFFSFSFVLLY